MITAKLIAADGGLLQDSAGEVALGSAQENWVGIMLPSAIIFLQLLLNDKELLGEQFVNKRWNNWVNWTIIIVLFVLSVILAAQVAAPNLFPAS